MKENHDIKQQAATHQYAWIWNYNAHVEHQHNYYGEPQECSKKKVFVPCELNFFDQKLFGSEERQPQLIALLKEVAAAIDIHSGREWFAVYAGYRYFKNQLAVKGDYTDFFADIEQLLPDVLTKIDTTKERTERYQKYTVLLGREVEAWYMDGGKLPPINEITMWRNRFEGDKNRYEKSCKTIIEVYKRFKQI